MGTYRWAGTTTDRTGTSLGAEFANGLLSQIGTLLSLLELLLGLAEFGQVEGGDFLGFLDLPLVCLDLLLQLVNQILHAFVVLAVLLRLEAQLLDATLGLAQVLLGIGVSSLFAIQFVLQLADALLQLLDSLLATLKGVGLGLIQTDLQFLDLLFKGLPQFLLGLGMILLGAQLIGKTGGINHSLLGLLLGVLGFVEELIQVGVQSLELRLQFPLGSGDGSVLGGNFVQLFVGIGKLLLGLATAAVGLLQQSAGLLEFVLQSVGTTLRDTQLFTGIVTGTLLFLKGGLDVLELLLVALDVLLGLGVSLIDGEEDRLLGLREECGGGWLTYLVGMIQSNLQLVDVGFQLLLHAQRLSLALGFGLKGGLHGVKSALVVLAGVLEFLFLLLDATVDFLAHLGQLKLSAEHLVLLLLKSSLSLLKSGLELVLLGLETLAGLLDLMDVAATLTDLVEQILDLISQVLVLTTHSLQLLLALLVGALKTEQLGGVVAALLLGGIQLSGQIINLELPFANDLVECLLLLLGGVGNGVGTVDLQLQILDFGGQTLLGLLQANALLVERLNGLLSLSQTGLQLPLGLLKLLRAGNTIGLVLAAPDLSLSVSLAQLTLQVSLALSLLLNLLAQVVEVVLQVAELAQKGGTLARLLVGQTLGILQLGGQRDLDLGQLRDLRFGLLQLAQQIGVLNRQLLLAGIEVVQSPVGLIQFRLHLVEGVLQLLGDLLLGSLYNKNKHQRSVPNTQQGPLQVVWP